jgi:2-polyprenyl-3-methyl-5-hydroxy-6-metoxy-1,4-benzoquinol methylase
MGSAGEIIEIHNKREFIQKPYSIRKCDSCGLYFKDEILDSNSINEYYNSLDSSVWNPKILCPTESEIEGLIRGHLQPGATILDYGCSQGRFLSKFVGQYDCVGFDIDLRATEVARGKGIRVMEYSVLESNKGSFDLIVLSDVFEHAMKPTDLVTYLFSLLKTGGILCVSTGYADVKIVQYDIADYWYFRTVQHFSMMSEKYVNCLRKELNAELVHFKICSHYDDLLMRKISHAINFTLRFFLYKNVSAKKASLAFKIIRRIPLLSRITRWYTQPHFIFAKDHVVVAMRKIDL